MCTCRDARSGCEFILGGIHEDPNPLFMDKAFAADHRLHIDPVFLFLVVGRKPIPIRRADGDMGFRGWIYWFANDDELAVKPGSAALTASTAARPGHYGRYLYHHMSRTGGFG